MIKMKRRKEEKKKMKVRRMMKELVMNNMKESMELLI
jgi:hypothetical protein